MFQLSKLVTLGIFTLFVVETSGQNFQLFIAGVAQDAGHPQLGCNKMCCSGKTTSHLVSSVAICDFQAGAYYLIDATPNITAQVSAINHAMKLPAQTLPSAVFLTHAHIGHYTGLMYLGREALSAHLLAVYAMPRMHSFLSENGPWSQLVALENISLKPCVEQIPIPLSANLSFLPIGVPHRDEFSETVGYQINANEKSALYIPDIDKWSKWSTSLSDAVEQNDYVLIDATFYSADELPGRSLSEIPHPTVKESMALLSQLPREAKNRVYFIHMNHTNPLLDPNSEAYKHVMDSGFNVATEGTLLPF